MRQKVDLIYAALFGLALAIAFGAIIGLVNAAREHQTKDAERLQSPTREAIEHVKAMVREWDQEECPGQYGMSALEMLGLETSGKAACGRRE